MEDIVYITGHKNPDTDSICSSIAYAELKGKLGVNAVPVRIGEINPETEFVLNYFGLEAPKFLETVRTQVSDLNMDIVGPVSEDISIKTAWSIMRKNNIKILPVADEIGKLLGIISLSDITESYMNALENNILSASCTPLRNITDTLKARLISGDEEHFHQSGKVLIAAMDPEGMVPFIENGDIVLLGNRKDTQIEAVKAGAGCIIATCGGHVEKEARTLAKEKNCVVLETAYDTFTTARLINQSVPISYIMTKANIVSFNINDFIDSIKDSMLQTRYRSYPVVDDKCLIKGFISRYHLISQKRKKIILLDHNEKMQTVDGIEQADILEIIDHHRIGDIQTGYPIYFKNDTVGSTSTLIAGMYFENGMKPSKKIAGILCAGIISDTLNLKSPTSTYQDTEMISKLSKIANINADKFSESMFKVGSALGKMSTQQILNYDFKDYKFDKYKIGIGQINSSDIKNLEEKKDSIIEYMEKICENKGYSLLMLLVTDIIDEGSYILFTGSEKALINKIFHAAPDHNLQYFKDVVSRKKQVIPMIANAIQSLST
ncbi:MAG TPA: putative manganese-dependent inorganic diphosphatase [Ruminiclostridium sp.]|jgi:manganese-dependent inorganic pyrophosphatase|nr:putative manganese-dependent inorganic diphosphatase [Ruminiclostridium sp.]